MSDLLGEALALWDNVAYQPAHLFRIVAAARNWHALSNPTDELIRALRSAGFGLDPQPILAELIAQVDALTDTAEPEEEK